MDNIFLAKTIINNHEKLIFTDGIKYSLVSDSHPKTNTLMDFLGLEKLQLSTSTINLDKNLTTEMGYLDLIEDLHIFATGCTFEWSDEKIHTTSDNDVYKKVYLSNRSMFFYKGNKQNLASKCGYIGLRPDSTITIPEAEVVVVFNKEGNIIGHTIGNDVTAVDIEKQNPLYQMQAKFYKGSIALLPLIKLGSLLPITNINCKVIRDNKCISETSYDTKKFNRSTQEIVDQLMKLELTPNGGFLLLGCGVSYPKDKGLMPKDNVIIQADFLPVQLQNNCEHIAKSNIF